MLTWDQIKGDWQQLSAKLKDRWDRLNREDLAAIAGNRDLAVDLLQQRYDWGKEQAEKELDQFIRRLTS